MSRRIAMLSWAAGVGFVAGCGPSQSSTDTATPEPTVAKATPTPVVPTTVPETAVSTKAPQTPAVPPAPSFAYPADAGGKKVAAVLTPSAALGPVAMAGSGPKSRDSSIDRGEVPLPKLSVRVPSIPNPPSKPVRPSAPFEGIPADLGQAAAENPTLVKLAEKPLVKASGAVNPGASDVPPLAKVTPDRAPLEDPTAEIATLRAVNTPLPAPFLSVWFVRFTIPDPFEFAEQLKGKTGIDMELGTAPVVVSPGK